MRLVKKSVTMCIKKNLLFTFFLFCAVVGYSQTHLDYSVDESEMYSIGIEENYRGILCFKPTERLFISFRQGLFTAPLSNQPFRIEGGYRILNSDFFNAAVKLGVESNYTITRKSGTIGTAIELTPGKFKIATINNFRISDATDVVSRLTYYIGAGYFPSEIGLGIAYGNRAIFYKNEETLEGNVYFKSGKISCRATLQIPTKRSANYARILASFQYSFGKK